MKKIVKQGDSICVNGLWYNQGDEYDADGSETEILPIETVKPKKQSEKKDEAI